MTRENLMARCLLRGVDKPRTSCPTGLPAESETRDPAPIVSNLDILLCQTRQYL